MKLNKEEFLKTEFGAELESCVTAWDYYLENKNFTEARIMQEKWEVYQIAMRQFYGIEYHFTRTSEYYGVCTEDKSDFLFKKEREEN